MSLTVSIEPDRGVWFQDMGSLKGMGAREGNIKRITGTPLGDGIKQQFQDKWIKIQINKPDDAAILEIYRRRFAATRAR